MSRRRRIDLALLLIIRRAERESGMLSRPRSEGPDTRTANEQGPSSDEADSRHSS
ncbi:MAG: hypothetical protein M3302_02035 [Actinomycetota bacterium]|nr:hypothetical protein [Actinomycetota bacterium]